MNRLRTSFFVTVALMSGATTLLGQTRLAHADFALKPNDRVVFYGDSITDQRLYTTFAETFVLTRYPKLPVTFVHSGWGGDTVGGGGGGDIELRMKRDILPYKPTVMTMMLGMNDGGYRAFDQGRYDTYTNGFLHILDTVKKADPAVRFTLIQPSPYDDVTRAPGFDGGYNGVLLRYASFLKDTAVQRNLTLADFNTPVVAMLQTAKGTNADLSQKILPDRVHPGPGGHLIMAEALMKAWDLDPTVTSVAIDAAGKKVVTAEKTKVSDLQTGATVSWTQNDESLPFPLDTSDPAVALAISSSDFVQAVDQEPLKVTGLVAPKYTLTIDDDEVGDFTKEQLAQGINLATLDTPMSDQARDVHRLTLAHNDQHFYRWRNIQEPLGKHSAAVQDSLPPLLKALDDEEAGTIAAQRAAAQPKPHRYQLTVAAPDPVGVNLAQGKPYTPSDPNVYGYGMGGLTDGSYSGDTPHTFATGDKDTFPKNVTIDLGAATPVGYIRIGNPAFGSTQTVKVSLSADGQNFTEVGTYKFPLATERRHLFSFAPLNARYVRLSYPDHYNEEKGYSNKFSFTSEVEAFAPNP